MNKGAALGAGLASSAAAGINAMGSAYTTPVRSAGDGLGPRLARLEKTAN